MTQLHTACCYIPVSSVDCHVVSPDNIVAIAIENADINTCILQRTLHLFVENCIPSCPLGSVNSFHLLLSDTMAKLGRSQADQDNGPTRRNNSSATAGWCCCCCSSSTLRSTLPNSHCPFSQLNVSVSSTSMIQLIHAPMLLVIH